MSRLKQLVPVSVAFGLGILVARPFVRHQAPDAPLPVSSQSSGPLELLAPNSGVHGKANPTATGLVHGGVAEILAQLKGMSDYQESNFLLYSMLRSANAARLAAFGAEFAAMPGTGGQAVQTFCTSLAKSWAKLDAPAALAWAESLPALPNGKNAVNSVLTAMSDQDPTAALARADSLPDAKARREARRSIASSLSKRDPEQALAVLSQDKSSNSRYYSAQIYADWAERDPLAAQQAVAALPSGPMRDSALDHVYRKLAEQDPLAAVTAAGNLPTPGQRKAALTASLSTWSATDPAAAWAFCQNLPTNDPARSAQSSILSNLLTSDPTKAIALIGKLSESDKAIGTFGSIINNWARNDSQAAIAFVAGLQQPKDRKLALQNLSYALDFSDPTATSQIFAQFPLATERKTLISAYLGNNAYSDPITCLNALQYLSPADQEKMLNQSSLITYLAKQDPALAIKTLEAYPGPRSDQQWSSLVSNLAENDPAQAYRTLQGLPMDLQNKALPGYLSGLARQDVPQALNLAQALPEGETRDRSFSNILSTWCRQDTGAVLAWAQTAPAKERAQALQTVLSRKAEDDPAGAITVFNSLLGSGVAEDRKTASSAISSLSHSLYRDDPAMASQWALNLTDQKMQKSAVSSIANQWTSEDPVEASAWIKQLPIGEAKDDAVQSLISNIKNTDPESAFAWALASGKPETRISLATSVLRTWIKNDPVAGKQALLNSPLNDEQRNKLLKAD